MHGDQKSMRARRRLDGQWDRTKYVPRRGYQVAMRDIEQRFIDGGNGQHQKKIWVGPSKKDE